MSISALLVVKNEENHLKRCLVSLKWIDEIIVIDDFSEDNTVKIALSRGARVFRRKLNRDFASQRNFALQKCRGDWALFVDADEVIPSPLAKEIVRRTEKNNNTGFLIPRREYFMGRAMKCVDKPIYDWSLGPIKLLRLAKKEAGKWVGRVHEEWQVKGKIGELKNAIIHNSFPDVDTALKKINLYSSIQAKDLHDRKAAVSILQIVFYPIGKFIKNFFWGQGFRDGIYGFIYCSLMSWHSFLTRSKLWILNRNDNRGNSH